MRENPDSVLENVISRLFHGDIIEEVIHYPSGSQMNPRVPHVSLLWRKVFGFSVLGKATLYFLDTDRY